ncbi:hypothetical protein [Membranihabitans marinus]|uniref:hypothetical protein n=1 Tax=Membranihabitans marinus TaxID=1227546 RepID=UPI001F218982|nr:hypothetical protein [Membranihabitans marinus]
MKSNISWIRYIVVGLFFLIILVTGFDLYRISQYKSFPIRPVEKIEVLESQLYYNLVNGHDFRWQDLEGSLNYIKNEYDCSDFRLVNLIRILYEYESQIPEEWIAKTEEVVLGFRYWWDEPGENSMCYWSENHQILFASAEYLIGQKYMDDVFTNSGITGHQHMEKARIRIMDWLEMRWNYGFTEFFSSVYYKEDIAALINLIDYAKDEEIVEKCRIIMDLLFYDVASQNVNTMFISASGRGYHSNRKGGQDATLGGLTQYYWGNGQEIGPGLMYGLMISENYKLPPVLKAIAEDSSTVIVKQSSGLDISDLEKEGFYGTNNQGMMMQWGMEAFVNPEIVRHSLAHIRNNNMFSNGFISDFKLLDFTMLDLLHLEPWVVKIIDSPFQGTAIQRGNTYTYKTADYSMYTAQSHHVGEYADQHHVFGINVSNAFAIYHTHPALHKRKASSTPNYEVGYGRLPHSVQDMNVNLSIYVIPEKKSWMEKELLDYTYAYFPMQKMDSSVVINNYAFGMKGQSYFAFIGFRPFIESTEVNNEIIQEGNQVYWIAEAGCQSEDGSFENFKNRIQNNEVIFNEDELILSYRSKDRDYKLKYGGEFTVDGKTMDTNYRRYQSPYIQASAKSRTLEFRFKEDYLYLDFENGKRDWGRLGEG